METGFLSAGSSINRFPVKREGWGGEKERKRAQKSKCEVCNINTLTIFSKYRIVFNLPFVLVSPACVLLSSTHDSLANLTQLRYFLGSAHTISLKFSQVHQHELRERMNESGHQTWMTQTSLSVSVLSTGRKNVQIWKGQLHYIWLKKFSTSAENGCEEQTVSSFTVMAVTSPLCRGWSWVASQAWWPGAMSPQKAYL